MAIADAYAVAADYRNRVDKTDTGDDTVLDAILLALSRLIDQQCGRHFTQDASAVIRHFDGKGQTRLYIDDVSVLTTVKVDLDADYDYDGASETLTLNTHFWIGPDNWALGSEPRPYRFLDVVPGNSVLTVWPEQRKAVQVTARFGWPGVPGAIKEATVLMAREVIDLQKSGFTLSLQNIDEAINMAPQAMSVLGRIKREYGRYSTLFV